jgi:hypothetical protein
MIPLFPLTTERFLSAASAYSSGSREEREELHAISGNLFFLARVEKIRFSTLSVPLFLSHSLQRQLFSDAFSGGEETGKREIEAKMSPNGALR